MTSEATIQHEEMLVEMNELREQENVDTVMFLTTSL